MPCTRHISSIGRYFSTKTRPVRFSIQSHCAHVHASDLLWVGGSYCQQVMTLSFFFGLQLTARLKLQFQSGTPFFKSQDPPLFNSDIPTRSIFVLAFLCLSTVILTSSQTLSVFLQPSSATNLFSRLVLISQSITMSKRSSKSVYNK